MFDQLEEQFDMPAAFVAGPNGEGRELEVVGEEHQGFGGCGVLESDAAQVVRIVLSGRASMERGGLVANQAGPAVGGSRGPAAGVEVRFGSGDEECACLSQSLETWEVERDPVHDRKGPCLREQEVKDVDIVQLAIGDVDKAGDGSAQVKQGMQLDGGLGGAKCGLGQHRQTQVDGRGIKGINGVRQFQAQGLGAVGLSRLGNQALGEVGIDAPVAPLVGIRQCRPAHRFAKAHAGELRGLGRETSFAVAQAFPVGELGKSHATKLLGATQCADAVVATVTRDQSGKGGPGQKVHQLSEQRLAMIHGILRGVDSLKHARNGNPRSNRHHPFLPVTPCLT